MSRPSAIIYVVAVVVLGAIILLPSDKESDSGATPSVPLNYSKPVFTTSITIVCPMSLLSDIRADHSPEKVVDMFSSVFTRSDKAKSLGCQELREDIYVSASPLADEFVSVGLPGDSGSRWFTLAGELTNKVPGQSDAERNEQAEPHIAKATDLSTPIPTTSPSSAGHFLVNTRSRMPIPKGDGVAAANSYGSGALICPDEERMAALSDATLDTSRTRTGVTEWEEYNRFGCSYVPPGTEMTSQGANEQGALAVVTAKLADGTTIHGLTFPNMFVENPVHREELLGERTPAAAIPQTSATVGLTELRRSEVQENDPAKEMDAGPLRAGTNGVGYPSCIYCPDPRYSEEARAAKVSGIVELQIVVEPDGHTTNIQIVKSLGHGLDESAIKAVQNWRFKAAMGPNGIPVPTIAPVEVTFQAK
jgi:TonB family protein